jgi:hypothetical protein
MKENERRFGRPRLSTPRWLRRLNLRFGIWGSEPLKVLDRPGVRRLSTSPGTEESDPGRELSQS